MLNNFDREKLLNVLIFFAQNTKFCGITKLFKLLYFLDFEHYKQTGRSVTGLKYYAWKMGPVPVSLREEIDAPERDFADKLDIETPTTKHERPMYLIKPKVEFNPAKFTKRELRILNSLVKEYQDTKADDMIEATHLETLPWHQVYNVDGDKQGLIPFEYAFRKDEVEIMEHIIKENEEIKKNYS